MPLETVPLLLGALVALLGLGLVADGWLPDSAPRVAERRRATRAERHRAGEVAIGIGMFALAAALAGRDGWRFGTVAVMAGVVLLAVGAVLNRGYLAERFGHRGQARRGRRRERRAERASERPVPLVVAMDADRRAQDRREAFSGGERSMPAVSRAAAMASPLGRDFASRPVGRAARAD